MVKKEKEYEGVGEDNMRRRRNSFCSFRLNDSGFVYRKSSADHCNPVNNRKSNNVHSVNHRNESSTSNFCSSSLSKKKTRVYLFLISVFVNCMSYVIFLPLIDYYQENVSYFKSTMLVHGSSNHFEKNIRTGVSRARRHRYFRGKDKSRRISSSIETSYHSHFPSTFLFQATKYVPMNVLNLSKNLSEQKFLLSSSRLSPAATPAGQGDDKQTNKIKVLENQQNANFESNLSGESHRENKNKRPNNENMIRISTSGIGFGASWEAVKEKIAMNRKLNKMKDSCQEKTFESSSTNSFNTVDLGLQFSKDIKSKFEDNVATDPKQETKTGYDRAEDHHQGEPLHQDKTANERRLNDHILSSKVIALTSKETVTASQDQTTKLIDLEKRSINFSQENTEHHSTTTTTNTKESKQTPKLVAATSENVLRFNSKYGKNSISVPASRFNAKSEISSVARSEEKATNPLEFSLKDEEQQKRGKDQDLKGEEIENDMLDLHEGRDEDTQKGKERVKMNQKRSFILEEFTQYEMEYSAFIERQEQKRRALDVVDEDNYEIDGYNDDNKKSLPISSLEERSEEEKGDFLQRQEADTVFDAHDKEHLVGVISHYEAIDLLALKAKHIDSRDDFFYTEEELKRKGASHQIHHVHQQDKTNIQTKASFTNPNNLIIEYVSMDLGRSLVQVAVSEEGICMLQEQMIVSSSESEMKQKKEHELENTTDDCDDYLADAIVTGDFDAINKIKENSFEKTRKDTTTIEGNLKMPQQKERKKISSSKRIESEKKGTQEKYPEQQGVTVRDGGSDDKKVKNSSQKIQEVEANLVVTWKELLNIINAIEHKESDDDHDHNVAKLATTKDSSFSSASESEEVNFAPFADASTTILDETKLEVEQLENINPLNNHCYALYKDGTKPWKIKSFSLKQGRSASLSLPNRFIRGPPSVLLSDGQLMHRMTTSYTSSMGVGEGSNENEGNSLSSNHQRVYKSFVGAAEETRRKLDALKLKNIYGKVLDTCTGLGYTAIAASRGMGVTEVVTCEIDQATIELCRFNPWSRSLFPDEDPSAPIEKFYKYDQNDGGLNTEDDTSFKNKNAGKNSPYSPTRHNIQFVQGDISEYITQLPSDSFAGIIHDPPPLSNSRVAPLYSTFFYEELYRVMKPRGRLFHYVGYTKSYDSSRKYKEVLSKLKRVGFSKVVVVPHAFGVIALKEDAKTIGKRKRLQEELNMYMNNHVDEDDTALFNEYMSDKIDQINTSAISRNDDNENNQASYSVRNRKLIHLLRKLQDQQNTVYISDRKKMKTRKIRSGNEDDKDFRLYQSQLFRENALVKEVIENLAEKREGGNDLNGLMKADVELHSKKIISMRDYPGSFSSLYSSSISTANTGVNSPFAKQKFRKVSMSKYQKLPNSPFNISEGKKKQQLIKSLKDSSLRTLPNEEKSGEGINESFSSSVQIHYHYNYATDEELKGILGIDEEEEHENENQEERKEQGGKKPSKEQ